MEIVELVAFGDSELVVQQIKGHYQKHNPRMMPYGNQVWDLIDYFYEALNITIVSREFNQQVDSLAVVAITFKTPIVLQMKYEIDMRYRPSMPKNIKYWKVFECDHQIKNFMEVIDEFANTHIDSYDEEESKYINEK